MSKNQILSTAKILVLALVLSVGLSYVMAWTGPTAPAPGGNTPAPINAGTVNQVKEGGLSVNSFAVTGNSFLSGMLGVKTVEISGDLTLDVEGKVGAVAYCDEDGENCKSVGELGSGGAGSAVLDCGDKAITKIDFSTNEITCKDIDGVTVINYSNYGPVSCMARGWSTNYTYAYYKIEDGAAYTRSRLCNEWGCFRDTGWVEGYSANICYGGCSNLQSTATVNADNKTLYGKITSSAHGFPGGFHCNLPGLSLPE